MTGENEDFQIAISKAEQLNALLSVMFDRNSSGINQPPLQELAIELATDVLYAIRRME